MDNNIGGKEWIGFPKETLPGTSDACPGCNGDRVQTRPTDGLKVICPACGGTGWIAPRYL